MKIIKVHGIEEAHRKKSLHFAPERPRYWQGDEIEGYGRVVALRYDKNEGQWKYLVCGDCRGRHWTRWFSDMELP